MNFPKIINNLLFSARVIMMTRWRKNRVIKLVYFGQKKCEKRRQAWVKLNINPSFIRQLIIFIKRRSWWNAIITVYRSNLPWFNKLINAHLVSRARKWFGNENVMYAGYILLVISENCFLFWRFLLLFRFASNDFDGFQSANQLNYVD